MQISIWPGGASSNAPGTIAWAGGAINWDSPDIQNYGYDFATFGQIEVECYNATSPPGTNSGKSYTYDNAIATNNTVVDGNKDTVLSSFADTGLDMTAGSNSSSSSGSSSTKTASSSPVASVPGGTASGPGSSPGQAGSGTSGDSSSSSGSASSSSASCEATGFSQNCGSSSSSSSGKSAGVRVERTTGASALAVVVALAGLLFL